MRADQENEGSGCRHGAERGEPEADATTAIRVEPRASACGGASWGVLQLQGDMDIDEPEAALRGRRDLLDR